MMNIRNNLKLWQRHIKMMKGFLYFGVLGSVLFFFFSFSSASAETVSSGISDFHSCDCKENPSGSCEKYCTAWTNLNTASTTYEGDPTQENMSAFSEAKRKLDIEALKILNKTGSQWKIGEVLSVGEEKNINFTDPSNTRNVFSRGLKLLVQTIATFAIVLLIIGGLLMITSEGDENRLQKGKNIFFYTIIGLIVAFMSYIGVQFVISLLFSSI